VTRRIAALAIAAIALLAACGDPGPAISDRASSWLQAEVTTARRAAAAGDFAAANAQLDQIDAAVAQFVKQNDLSASRARAVSAAVDDVRGAMRSYAATSTTSTTTTTTTPPTTHPDRRGKHDKGPGKGSGPNDNGD
jgi:hypothetical protein